MQVTDLTIDLNSSGAERIQQNVGNQKCLKYDKKLFPHEAEGEKTSRAVPLERMAVFRSSQMLSNWQPYCRVA